MKKFSLIICLVTLIFGLCSCSSGSAVKQNTETVQVKAIALWYLASDDTDGYTGDIEKYDSSQFSKLNEWVENNTGELFESAELDDSVYTLTMTEEQKQDFLAIVTDKYEAALEQVPEISFFVKSLEADDKENTMYVQFDPDQMIAENSGLLDSLVKQNVNLTVESGLRAIDIIIFGNFWQLKGNLENGEDYAGKMIYQNADTGYTLMTLNMSPNNTDSAKYSNACIRTTKYHDYDGTLEFHAKFVETFTDDSCDGTFWKFKTTDDCCYEKGEIVYFRGDSLPVEVSAGDKVDVTFDYDDSPDDRAFTSQKQGVCFEDESVYKMTK